PSASPLVPHCFPTRRSSDLCLSWTRHYLNDREFAGLPLFGPDLLTWLACFFPWVLFTPLIFRFERRFPLSWRHGPVLAAAGPILDRKSTRLNSSHLGISYAV